MSTTNNTNSDLSPYATKSELSGKANSSDLNNYLPREDQGYKITGGSGQYRWCKFATMTIKSAWVDYPICFEVSGRGRLKSTLQVLFQGADDSDPELGSFTSDNDTNFYIKKIATSTWELYYLYNGAWGELTIYRVVNDATYARVTIDTTLENLSSEPTDKIQCVSNYLPLSGGNMTGRFIGTATNDTRLSLMASNLEGKGAILTLCGKDYDLPGEFYLDAIDNTQQQYIHGKPDGTLTWGPAEHRKPIDCIEEQGDGYIRYSSGLQICWGHVEDGANETKAYPKPFKTNSYVIITGSYIGTSSQVLRFSNADGANFSFTKSQYDWAAWQAIGFWK